MYVEELIGPDTVNTMPEETIEAFQDHGEVARHARAGHRRGAAAVRRAARGRRRLRRRVGHARARGRAEVRRLVHGAEAGDRTRSAKRWPRSSVSRSPPSVVERIWARDPTVWTGGDEAQWLGWLDEPQRMLRAARRGPRVRDDVVSAGAIDDVVLLGMGGSSLAPEVLRLHVRRRALPRARHDASEGDPRARVDRSTSQRTLFLSASKSGTTLETRSHTAYFLEARRRSSWRSPIPAPSSSGSRASAASARLPRRADDRRPLLGALAVRDRAGGADGHRRDAAARARGRDGEACRLADGNPGLELGLALGERLASVGRDKVCIADRRLRPLGRAADRRVDRQAGQGPRARARRVADGPDRQRRRSRSPSPYELGQEFFRWEFARRRRRLDPRDQPVRPAGRAGGEGQDERGARAGRRRARAGGLGRRAARAGARGRLRLHPGVRRPGARRRDARAARRPRARDAGCVVTHGLGPRYLHSTGQLHKGGPNTGLFLQVVDDTGEELPIPGRDVRLRAADPRAGGRRLRVAEGARPPRRARQTGGAADAARNDRPRPHGRQHDEAARASTGTR